MARLPDLPPGWTCPDQATLPLEDAPMTEQQTPAPEQAPERRTTVALTVDGVPTAARVVTAALTLAVEAMLGDGWDRMAIAAALHQQVEAVAIKGTEDDPYAA